MWSIKQVNTEEYIPSTFYNEFKINLEYISNQQGDELHRGLYFSNIISLMEKYLLDLFISEISNDRNKVVKLATHPRFKTQSVKLTYALNNSIENYTINSMKNIVWHRLNDIDIFYKTVLNIRFNITSKLLKKLTIRHHIVHRNCHDTNGGKVYISQETLQQCIDEVNLFIKDIDKKYCQSLIL